MINKKVIFNFIGIILLLESIFMLLGIGFSIYYKEDDLFALLSSGIFIGLLSIVFFKLSKGYKKEVSNRDGYLIVSLSWLILSIFGALPFIIHGSIPNYTDAFFETMSGFTTTGASILNDIEKLPHGLLYWRSVIQWLGGMGIIVLSLAILPILGVGGMQLFVAEVPGPTKDKIHPRIRETAVMLWGMYLAFTALETVLLMIGGLSFFDATCHSFTTMATGGFSTKNASIAYFDSPFVQYVFIIFMFFAGVNFSLHYFLFKGKVLNILKNEEFRFYTFIIIFFSLLVTITILATGIGSNIESTFRHSVFQVVSIVTTTGYITQDYELWGVFYQVLFFILLFVGGSSGSTGGSIKVVRHLLLIKNSFIELKRLIHPRAVYPVLYNHQPVPNDIIAKVLAFFLFYIVLFIFSSLVMTIMGIDFVTAMGAVATSISNVGPGIGKVGPSFNFSHLPAFGKWLLSFLMLLGRLELFTVLVVFTRTFWKR